MESITGCELTQEDFIKAKERYLELKCNLMFENYKTEKEQIIDEKIKLNEEWEFDEESEG